MTWIRFDPEEPAASLNRLFDLPGASPALANLHGKANLIIFFAHSLECPACRKTIDEFAGRAADYLARDAVVIIVLQAGHPAQARQFFPLHVLIDPSGAARQQLGRLLEFDTHGKLLLVILNAYAAPSAAWIGADPAPEDEIQARSLQRLDYVSIQCPE